MRRTMLLVAAMAALFAAFAVPAAARPPAAFDGGEDKVTICHATNSLTNPYVVITIDAAAWNPDQDFNGPKHGEILHAREKDGYTWTDFLFPDGVEPILENCLRTPPTTTPPPSAATCASTGDDIYVVGFNGVKLISHHSRSQKLTTPSVGTFRIPSGEYLVTLGSRDQGHPARITTHKDQVNEQWRADFGVDGYSAYSDDLPNSDKYGETVVGTVTLYEESTTSITAEHWDANDANHSDSPDSIVPVCVVLVRVGDANGT